MLKRMMSLIVVLLLAVNLVGLIPMEADAAGNKAADARNGVVRILAVGANESGLFAKTGSGFAIGTAGEPSAIFVTNQHVIAGTSVVYILLDDAWYSEWKDDMFEGVLDSSLEHIVKCEVIYTPDSYPDYAILRAERVITERVALAMMPAEMVSPADTIYTLGYPAVSDIASSATGGQAQLDEIPASVDAITISKGAISRFTTMESEKSSKVIQVDADINSGNSGGPLITEDGYVIGINTWSASRITSGGSVEKTQYSLEINYVLDRVKNLKEIGVLPGFEPTVIDGTQPTEPETVPATEAATVPVTVPTTQPETQPVTQATQPVQSGDSGNDSSMVLLLVAVLLVVVVAVVVLVVLLLRKKQPVTTAAPMQQSGAAYPRTMPVQQTYPNTMPAYSVNAYRLVCESGFFAGRRFAIDHPVRLGRDPQKNDLVFSPDTAGVSGVHCVVSPVADGVSLTDLGSSYGTALLDGTMLTPNQSVILQEGDGFYVGGQGQVFRIERK